jgi:zinc protease
MKHKTTKFFAAVTLFSIATAGTYAQATATPQAAASPATAKAPLPSADQVIDSYEKAIGGRDAWMKIKSRISTGTIEVPAFNVTGTVEVHQKAPDKLLSVAVVAGQAYKRGFDGTVAWADDPQNGLKEDTGAALASAKRESDFYHQFDLRKLYSKLTVTSIEKVGDHDAYLVEAVTPDGATDKLYFDTKTSLLVRSQNHRVSPDGADVLYTGDIEDYRDVDGIKLPFVVHQSSEQASFTITYSDIKQNVDLTDEQFSKPKPE